MDQDELENRISKLEETAHAAIQSGRGDWRALWREIRELNAEIRDVRFDNSRRRQEIRSSIQLVAEALKAQRVEHEERRAEHFAKQQALSKTSSQHLREFMRILANAAREMDHATYMIFETFATGGANLVLRGALDLIFGETDEIRAALERRSKAHRTAGAYLRDNKDQMRGTDKSTAHAALVEQRALLDADWASWKEAKAEAYRQRQVRREEALEKKRIWEEKQRIRAEKQLEWEEKQRAWKAKHEAWRAGQEAFLEKLDAAHDRKRAQLEHQCNHLKELFEKLSSAYNESYRDRVEEWIDETKDRIEGLERAIADIEDNMREVRSKLDESD